MAHNELIRSGTAWVGVSAQKVGVDASISNSPARYSSLVHPGDSYSYNIFSRPARGSGTTLVRRCSAGSSRSG